MNPSRSDSTPKPAGDAREWAGRLVSEVRCRAGAPDANELPPALMVVFAADRLHVQFPEVRRYEVPAEPVASAVCVTTADGQEAPHVAFVLGERGVTIAVHPSVPLGVDGFPDLRILGLPPSRWGELRPAKRRSSKPLPMLPELKVPADRIQRGILEMLSRGGSWNEADGADGFSLEYGSSDNSDTFSMVCRPNAGLGEAAWEQIMSHGEMGIKLNFALWARFYEQTGGDPSRSAMMDVSQLCSDLGYAPHVNGGFKKERKQEVLAMAIAFTQIRLCVRFQIPGKVREINGPLWMLEGVASERPGKMSDKLPPGAPDPWEPISFSYSPGVWFANADWRRWNKYLGLISGGMMKLRHDRDQTAIRIGGYLSVMARFNQYRPRVFRMDTILRRVGMADGYAKDPGRLQDKLEDALHKLVEVGVLAGWSYTDADRSEPDMDDPEELAALGQVPPGDWRRRTIEVKWPECLAAEAERLQQAEQRAVVSQRRRQKRLPETVVE